MPLKSVQSGQPPIKPATRPCDQLVHWTIQVKNDNRADTPNLARTAVTVQVGEKSEAVTTDDNGLLTLIFDAKEKLAPYTVSVTHNQYEWKGDAGAAVKQAGTQYLSEAHIKGVFNLVIRVNSPGATSSDKPVALGGKGIVIQWADQTDDKPKTGTSGGAYRKSDAVCETEYTIAAAPELTTSSVIVKIGMATQDVSTADARKTAEDATVSRTAANKVKVTALKNGTTVVIDFIVIVPWKLSVAVKHAGAAGATGEPAAIGLAPIRLQWGSDTPSDVQTTAEGNPYTKADMVVGREYTLSIRDTLGAKADISTATVKAGDKVLDVKTADKAASDAGVTVTRAADNKLKIKADKAADVKIEFLVGFAWKLSVLVKDNTLKADGNPMTGAAVALRQVPVRLKWATTTLDEPGTGTDASAYKKEDMAGGTEYIVSLKETFGAIDTGTTVQVKVNTNAVDVTTADRAVTRDHVKVVRTAANLVKLTVDRGAPAVEVTWLLEYPKVFIVGEGPSFPYAIGLAKRYAKGEAAASRTIGTKLNAKAPATALSDVRKWIVVSQFDVHAPPTTLPPNLIVYRDAVLRDFSNNLGCFDVRKQVCWTRMTTIYGRFEAIIFNNPHPGYGMHRCNVFGLRDGHTGEPGKYISVHSLGWGNTLSGPNVGTFRTYGNIVQNSRGKWIKSSRGTPTRDMELAGNQRYFLQTDVVCVRPGTDSVVDFGDDGSDTNRSISSSFTALTDGGTAFSSRVTHYQESRDTTGLWASILRCYRLNGNAALKDGGALYLHGTRNFGNLCGRGKHLEGFALAGTWSDDGNAGAYIYYANYPTNFTSDTFHPSWFADVTFGPGEPNLSDALCYKRDKT